MKRSKQVRGERTKKQILNTALKLFSEKGYDHVTVDEIVKESNSSKGSFYFHFESKHNIILEKFKEIDHYYSEYYNAFPKDLSAPEKIILFVNKQMSYIQSELGLDLMRVIYSNALMPGQNKYFIDQDRPLFTIIESIIEEGQQKGEIKTTSSVEELKFIVVQGLMGAIYHWCMNTGSYDLQEVSEKFFVVIVDGLKT
ncbi:TetR/AcrR family transcriptional regulator [Oceanobacillus jeddahense]|uniref:TetR/AcrR family transcriptional regulator n=1 Tax=Oceanobacillus jeddahense TaxID=1462527 RepID=UPI0005958A11|nr:TetR/AcrR family transcriptional regulator [Oceanobacillus jeddahense]